MPRPELMTWEGAPSFRWVKMYKGTRFKITCDQLNAPRDKNQSINARSKRMVAATACHDNEGVA